MIVIVCCCIFNYLLEKHNMLYRYFKACYELLI